LIDLDMNSFHNVLLIEDNPGDTRLVTEYLHERFGNDCAVRGAATLEAGLAQLRHSPADIVLLDLGLPDSVGLETFSAVNAAAPNTPVVILSGDDDEQVAMRALQVGAEDYLAKRHADSASLIRSMRHAVQRRRMSVRLRDSEARYRTIVETAEEGIVQLDSDATIRFANTRLCNLLGSSDLVGRSFTELVKASDLPALMGLMCTAPGERNSAELRLLGADGSATWVVAAAGCLVRHPGSNPQLVVMLSDISARKLAEAELLALKRGLEARVAERTAQLHAANVELESFNYTVAHDLRTPLGGILGFAELMRTDGEHLLPAPQAQQLAMIEHSARTMQGLIDSLLALSKISHQVLHPQTLDLSTMARRVADQLQVSEPLRPVQWLIADHIEGEGDANLVADVLGNLLHNAWKYSAKAERAVIHFGVLPNITGNAPVYVVRDNGIGFEMATATRLFSPFQRLPSARGFEGSGIGLATARRIIERHGGTLWAESEPGQGASFYFTLGGRPPLAA
jgi:PAS domain S-box-containing protein